MASTCFWPAHAYRAQRPRNESKQNSNRAPLTHSSGGWGLGMLVVLVVLLLLLVVVFFLCSPLNSLVHWLRSLLLSLPLSLCGCVGVCASFWAICGDRLSNGKAEKTQNSVYRKRVRGAEVAARGHHNGVLDLSV